MIQLKKGAVRFTAIAAVEFWNKWGCKENLEDLDRRNLKLNNLSFLLKVVKLSARVIEALIVKFCLAIQENIYIRYTIKGMLVDVKVDEIVISPNQELYKERKYGI